MIKIIDILDYINNTESINTAEIAFKFQITNHDAANRIYKLHKSGLIKKIKPTTYPPGYEITSFGKNYLKYKQENPGKRIQWNALIPKDKRK